MCLHNPIYKVDTLSSCPPLGEESFVKFNKYRHYGRFLRIDRGTQPFSKFPRFKM